MLSRLTGNLATGKLQNIATVYVTLCMLKIINIYKVAFIPVVAQKDIRNRKCQNNNAFTPTEMNYFHICKTAKKETCRVFIMNILLLFYSPLDYYSNSQSSQKRRQRKAYPNPKQ